MRRILYVHHGSGIGGAPLSLLYLIRGLDRARYHPTVLCLHESEAAALFRRDGIETFVDASLHDFSHTNVLWYPWWQFPKLCLRAWQTLPTYVRARRLLRGGRFDAVHLNTSTLTAVGLAAKAAGVRVIWHVREPLQKGYFGIRRALIRRIIDRAADLVIPICRHDAEQLIPSPRIHVVYNFIDFSQFDATIDGGPLRAELGIAPTAPVVTMLGGINPIKGTLPFVTAAVEVLATVPEAVFLVAGPIPGDTFRNRVNGLRVYRESVFSHIPHDMKHAIRFLGIRGDIPALLAASDLLCFPSTVPHFARPVIEAGAMGRPVIASDLGGPRELVRHGETGLLVRPGDAPALAAAIRELLDDPARARALGRQGITHARTYFDAEKNTRTVTTLYDALFARTESIGHPSSGPGVGG
ncbi:MAG: glycosyltransferase family 4 protein [Bacteroidota bacterium]|nr:glycosyltransferase family 4 protein [Bacteroidota bacterium]